MNRQKPPIVPPRHKLTAGAAACATALLLAGCTAFSAAGTSTPTASAESVSAGVRELHSPGEVTEDLHLDPGQCHARTLNGKLGLVLPDPACTPGAIDPAVTQDNLASTICRKGYTATVRPPASNTGAFKHRSLLAYGMRYTPTAEYDHLISLELGGTNTVSNLWPEPNAAGASTVNNPKDLVENHLHQAVCAGKATLAAAQQAIATDWTTAEARLRLPTTSPH